MAHTNIALEFGHYFFIDAWQICSPEFFSDKRGMVFDDFCVSWKDWYLMATIGYRIIAQSRRFGKSLHLKCLPEQESVVKWDSWSLHLQVANIRISFEYHLPSFSIICTVARFHVIASVTYAFLSKKVHALRLSTNKLSCIRTWAGKSCMAVAGYGWTLVQLFGLMAEKLAEFFLLPLPFVIFFGADTSISVLLRMFLISIKKEGGFGYVFAQCMFKAYHPLDEYRKSGQQYESVSAILGNSTKGWGSVEFPTDKATRHNYTLSYDVLLAPYQHTARTICVGWVEEMWHQVSQDWGLLNEWRFWMWPSCKSSLVDNHKEFGSSTKILH